MSQELVFVATFDNPLLANIAKGRLEAEGIPAFLHNERFVEMQWLWANASGGIGLLVPPTDEQRARAILAEPAGKDAPGDSDEVAESPEEVEEVLDPPNLRELDAARAIKSAVLGLLFCPLQIYTAWLLIMVAMADEPLRPRYYWCSLGAAAMLAPYLILAVSVFMLIFW